jgi:APA family basic amino acid/polyamine antiporter
MTIAGPRVTEAMGEDYSFLKSFSIKNKFGMPYIAILVQSAWSIFLVVVSSFKEIIQYISVSLSIFSMLTVIGVFFLRRKYSKEERPFQLPLYPILPIVFIVTTSWMIYYVTKNDYRIMLYSVLTMIPGLMVYLIASRKKI